MQLVNATPVPADVFVSDVGGEARFGMVVAKATFRFEANGPFEVDAADPVPLLPADVPTPVGLLPRDDLPRTDTAFDVLVLGQAHAPGGRAVREMRVKARVGSVQRELAVFGDRVWQGSGASAKVGPAAPFTRMPLVWNRAFGGMTDVLIDKESPVLVADPLNRLGKGFDHARMAVHLGEAMAAPAGYPQFDPVRPLPNLENPTALITKWDDAPRPVCWAPVPLDIGLHTQRSADVIVEPDELPEPQSTPTLFQRAHPDWVIPVPKAGSPVVLDGLTPDELAAFRIPQLRVLADWVVGDRTGTSELVPQSLVILPDERRFYLVYRLASRVFVRPGTERSIRLRLAEGWYQPPGGN